MLEEPHQFSFNYNTVIINIIIFFLTAVSYRFIGSLVTYKLNIDYKTHNTNNRNLSCLCNEWLSLFLVQTHSIKKLNCILIVIYILATARKSEKVFGNQALHNALICMISSTSNAAPAYYLPFPLIEIIYPPK